MSGLTKAQRAERIAAAVEACVDGEGTAVDAVETLDSDPQAFDADDGLVAMKKQAVTLLVHPSCVKAHQAHGWVEQ